MVARYFPTRRLFIRGGVGGRRNHREGLGSSRAEHPLGFRCETDFGRFLDALRAGGPLPFII